MRALVLMLLYTALGAAVDGDPHAPYPYNDPAWWLDSTNDGVISMRHHDDGLSAQLRAGREGRVAWAAAWDLDTDIAHQARADQLTVDAGPEVTPGLRLMPGLRLTGDLGGEAAQNSFHQVIGDRPVLCSYAGRLLVEPVLLVAWRPRLPRVWHFLVPTWSMVGSASPECQQADATAGLELAGTLSLEVGWTLSRCTSPQAAVRLARDGQRGPHMGFAVQAMHVGWGICYGDHEVIGRVGLVF